MLASMPMYSPARSAAWLMSDMAKGETAGKAAAIAASLGRLSSAISPGMIVVIVEMNSHAFMLLRVVHGAVLFWHAVLTQVLPEGA